MSINSISTVFKKQLAAIFLILTLISTPAYCNIWDNIFSQTQATHPLSISESFNIDFELPEQYALDGNIDFNSQLKSLTLTLSKNILIQKVNIIKGQVDLQSLILNVDQFLIGCEKFSLGIDDKVNTQVQKRINSANFSKKSLFLVNLLFKYIGQYELGQNGKPLSQKDVKPHDNKQKHDSNDLLDIFKNNKIFDSIAQSGILGDLAGTSENKKKKVYNMFEFSVGFIQDSKNIMDKIKQQKDEASKVLDIGEQLEQLDISKYNLLKELKFVVLANQTTGQIVKAFRNREMQQQLEFKLHSNEKTLIKCNKQAKVLTMDDLTNGAKYLYDNKDTIDNVFGG